MTDSQASTSLRAEALANRLEQGAKTLADLAETLSDSEWQTTVPGDGRSVGVVVHHVAAVYPVEIELAQVLASGKPIAEVTMNVIHEMNARHKADNASVTKAAAIELLKSNSKAAAQALRGFTDEQLDSAATVSLYADAPLTAQFFIEDHALRHSYHHCAGIRAALKK